MTNLASQIRVQTVVTNADGSVVVTTVIRSGTTWGWQPTPLLLLLILLVVVIAITVFSFSETQIRTLPEAPKLGLHEPLMYADRTWQWQRRLGIPVGNW